MLKIFIADYWLILFFVQPAIIASTWVVAVFCYRRKYQDEHNAALVAEYLLGHTAGHQEGFNRGETSGYFQGVRSAVSEMKREVGVRESVIMSRN